MQDPQIIQIAPANGAYALFGGREIGDQGEMQQHIADRLPVICWALVASIDACVMGMVAMECGEIALVSQREDFLGYEINGQKELGQGCLPCGPKNYHRIIPAHPGTYKTAITRRGVKAPEMYLLSPDILIHGGKIVDVIVSDCSIQVYDAIGQLIESFDFLKGVKNETDNKNDRAGVAVLPRPF